VNLRSSISRILIGLLIAVSIVAVPVMLFIGVNCYGRGGSDRGKPAANTPADIPSYARAEAFTFLTLPEWFIVYSTDDYASFVQKESPSDFRYVGAVFDYWSYYKAACDATSRDYPFEGGYHMMLGVIGASFTIENLLKAIYENSIGRFTAWWSGRGSAEDAFAAKVSAEYGAFMHTTPWYEFPFRTRLRQLWREVPSSKSGWLRRWERRMALSAEYTAKAVYGWLIGLATRSAYSPEDLKIHARIENAPDSIFRNPDIQKVKQLGTRSFIVTIPRYEAFTKTALNMLRDNVRFVDVAGNDEMLVSAIAPASMDDQVVGLGTLVARRPMTIDDERNRLAFRVRVAKLHEAIPTLRAAGATIEHLYDY
jgi:hypothetical protein